MPALFEVRYTPHFRIAFLEEGRGREFLFAPRRVLPCPSRGGAPKKKYFGQDCNLFSTTEPDFRLFLSRFTK